MGIIANQERFHLLTEALAGHAVESCLPYPGMTAIPAGYSRFAQRDALRRAMDWDEACPAYALAAITMGAYSLPRDDEALEILWDELGGASSRLWPEMRPLLREGWHWLGQQD